MGIYPLSIRQGTRKLIFVKAKDGTSPFTFKLYIDSKLKDIYYGTETYHGFFHTFNEETGFHEYNMEITDSCLLTSSDPCSINVIYICPPTNINFSII